MSFLIIIWNWFLSWFDDPSDSRITIGAHCYAPLFLRNTANKIDATWNALSKSPTERKHLRAHLKANAKSGETPACVFLATPENVNGGIIPNGTKDITDAGLNYLESVCKEFVGDGIAVGLFLYCDDPQGNWPRWWEIDKHRALWTKVNGRVGKYLTFICLSIETNERLNSVSQLDGCIRLMKDIFKDIPYFGTHLQWQASNGKYSWRGIAQTPASMNVVFAEYTWDPNKGNQISEGTFRSMCKAIQGANPNMKIVHQEFNVDAMSAQGKRQTEILREEGVWGVAMAKINEVEV